MKGEGGLENRLQVERCDDPPVLRAQRNGLYGEERLTDGSRLEDIQSIQGSFGWFGRVGFQ